MAYPVEHSPQESTEIFQVIFALQAAHAWAIPESPYLETCQARAHGVAPLYEIFDTMWLEEGLLTEVRTPMWKIIDELLEVSCPEGLQTREARARWFCELLKKVCDYKLLLKVVTEARERVAAYQEATGRDLPLGTDSSKKSALMTAFDEELSGRNAYRVFEVIVPQLIRVLGELPAARSQPLLTLV